MPTEDRKNNSGTMFTSGSYPLLSLRQPPTWAAAATVIAHELMCMQHVVLGFTSLTADQSVQKLASLSSALSPRLVSAPLA